MKKYAPTGSGEPYITPLEDYTDYVCFIKDIRYKAGQFEGKPSIRLLVRFVTEESKDTEDECYIGGYGIATRIPAVGVTWQKYPGSKQDVLLTTSGIGDQVHTAFGGMELENDEDCAKLAEMMKHCKFVITTKIKPKDEQHVYANVHAIKPYKEPTKNGTVTPKIKKKKVEPNF